MWQEQFQKHATGHQHIKVCKETGKIATEFCKDIEEKTVLQQPDKEKNATWKTSAGGKYNTITETCNVHTSQKKNKTKKIIKIKRIIIKIHKMRMLKFQLQKD